MGEVKTLIIDDHDLLRRGIRGLMESVPSVTVIGEGDSGEQALELARTLKPDLIFMDVRMPGMGGLEAVRRLRVVAPEIKVIVITALNDDATPLALLKAGALGYITKSAEAEVVEIAVKTVMRGAVYVCPSIAQQLVQGAMQLSDDDSPFSQLSERELQITQMVTGGRRAQEIAETLNISTKTISTYKYRVFEKLGVKNDVELTLMAVKFGLIDPNEAT